MLLLESPVAVLAIGILLVAIATVYYLQTRSRLAFATIVSLALLTVAAVLVERMWQTPREQVRAEIASLFAAIEANDLPAVLLHLDKRALEVRSDAESIMPRVRVQSAGQGGEVSIDFSAADAASATLKPLIRVVETKSGVAGAYFDDLTLDFVRRDDRWLLRGYRPATDWRERGQALSR